MKYNAFAGGIVLLASLQSNIAFSQTAYSTACAGGQGATTTTNIVLRNLPPNASMYTINNVKIYNQNGSIVYNGLPPGMATTLNTGVATGFSSKDIIDVNTGRITVIISFMGSTSAYFYGLSANLETDSTGRIISRDTVVCR